MATRTKKKPQSSGARLTAAGLKPVQLWLTQELHDLIFSAAAADGRAATQFLIFHGVKAAKKILENSGHAG